VRFAVFVESGVLTAVVTLAVVFGVGLGMVAASVMLWLDERDEAKGQARRRGW